MTQRELPGISSHKECISQTWALVLLMSPSEVVVHRHEDNSSKELLLFTIQFLQYVLDLEENLQRVVPWEHHPLEFHRLSTDSIQFSVLFLSS